MKLVTQSIVVAFVVMSVVITAKYFLADDGSNSTKEVIRLNNVKDCNIVQSKCLFVKDNQELSISLSGSIRTMVPFKLSAEVFNFNSNIEKISALFSMKSMKMGFNTFRLSKQQHSNITDEFDLWAASVLLPVCVSKRTDWNVTVKIETATKIFEVDIPVEIH